MATSTRMFVPSTYQPGFIVEFDDGWQYCILIDAAMVTRDTVYETRSDAVADMLAEVAELNRVYSSKGVE